MSGGAFDREDGTGRHIVQPDGAHRIDKGRDAGVMGEQGDDVILVIQVGDDLSENGWRGVIEIGDDHDVFVLLAEFTCKQFGGVSGPFGGAGDKTVDDDASLDQSPGHDGSIFFASVVQRTIDVGGTDIVPTTFCVPDDQKGLHYA